MDSLDVHQLGSLSQAERLEALAQTGLVQYYNEGDFRSGLSIIHGAFIPNSDDEVWPVKFPEELLSADDPVGKDARRILLSRNRIVLDGRLRAAWQWLTDFEDSLEHIVLLDIAFRLDTFQKWLQPGSTIKEDWQKVVKFIVDKMNIEKLDLSLDSGQVFEDWQERRATEEDIPYVRQIHSEIVEILAEALQGRKPKAFQVYWAAFHDQESQAEKRIMGNDYDTAALGKDPPDQRIIYFPHGAPDDSPGWERGMGL